MPAPVIYLSHGAPPLADDARWTRRARRLVRDLAEAEERAHGLGPLGGRPDDARLHDGSAARSTTSGASRSSYYEVTYDAPAAPDLADEVTKLLTAPGQTSSTPVHRDESRGLDHGAYVPLKEMFPDADVPVLQMSMPTLDPRGLFEIGRKLAPLRDQGTLIVGSGFTTHNLRWFNPRAGADGAPPMASAEFDHWAQEAMKAQDVDSLLDFLDKAPAAREAHPRTEHFAPLFVTLGAAYESGGLDNKSVIDGFWFGLSKRSWQFN